jgi:hypothetical protein
MSRPPPDTSTKYEKEDPDYQKDDSSTETEHSDRRIQPQRKKKDSAIASLANTFSNLFGQSSSSASAETSNSHSANADSFEQDDSTSNTSNSIYISDNDRQRK